MPSIVIDVSAMFVDTTILRPTPTELSGALSKIRCCMLEMQVGSDKYNQENKNEISYATCDTIHENEHRHASTCRTGTYEQFTKGSCTYAGGSEEYKGMIFTAPAVPALVISPSILRQASSISCKKQTLGKKHLIGEAQCVDTRQILKVPLDQLRTTGYRPWAHTNGFEQRCEWQPVVSEGKSTMVMGNHT
jgi:hypothetical protein